MGVKCSPATVAEEPATGTDMVGMKVWWLVTEATAGSIKVAANLCEVPPGAGHALHRHPGAEEVLIVLDGDGTRLGADPEQTFPVTTGDMVLTPAGEWHGFANTGDRTARISVVYGGVATRAAAGYDEHPDGRARLQALLNHADTTTTTALPWT